MKGNNMWEFYCDECERWISGEEYGYGHDCEAPEVHAQKMNDDNDDIYEEV